MTGVWGPKNPSSMGGGGEGKEENCDNHLPLLLSEDVLIQILLWLPVISLLRFKSVCKSWRSIIQSPFFINLHHSTTPLPSSSSSSKLGGSSLLFQGYEEEKEGRICTLSGEEFEVFGDLVIPPFDSVFDLFEEVEVLKVFKEWVRFYMVGCCNGIICLHESSTRNVALWNPAIRQSRLLPKPSNLLGYPKWFDKLNINDDDGYSVNDIVRFGIDIKTNDHKVLLITTYQPKSNDYKPVVPDVFVPFENGIDPGEYESDSGSDEGDTRFKGGEFPPYERRVHVYSLNADSWKCIEEAGPLSTYPYLDIDTNNSLLHRNGLHKNGRYFFTAQYFKDYFMYLILSFDFTEENFRTIQPPCQQRGNYRKYLSKHPIYFIPFGEKIALVDPRIGDSEEWHNIYEYDIWVLNEQHGVKESWSKFYTIGPPTGACNLPLCITNNGEFAIICWHWQEDPHQDAPKLQLLNLVTGDKQFLRCDFKGMSNDKVHVYKPSLVPIG